MEIHDKTAPFPDDEIDQLLKDMAEIKHLLFCRLLLSHAAALPAAMKANSIDEFLNDKEVTDTDLRDLTLKIDNPGLQEIRDACADLGRGDEDDDDEDDEESEEEPEVDRSLQQLKRFGLSEPPPPQHGLPRNWAPEREKRNTKEKGQRQELEKEESNHIENPEREVGKPMIDFGELDDQGKFKSKKIRVKICGRYIYNYPSERAISRGGWLQFCLIAKNSDLHDAIRLCRHWDQFFVLNVLSMYQYFPAAKWLVWKGDRLRQQLLQLVSFPTKSDISADTMTIGTDSIYAIRRGSGKHRKISDRIPRPKPASPQCQRVSQFHVCKHQA